MSQAINWGVPQVSPATPTTMADRMQKSLDALLSENSGASAPDYKVTGTRWADTSVSGNVAIKQWDGVAWRLLYSIDTTTGKISLPARRLSGPLDADGNAIVNMRASFLPGYLFALTASNNVSDADHDIDFAVGAASSDDADPLVMRLASAMTKRADASFAAGSGNGAMVAGESMPSSGTIHWWLIMKADFSVDICCNNHASSGLNPTLPSGYVYKRRICSLITDSSARFVGFTQAGNYFEFKVTQLAINTTGVGTSPTAYTINVPLGIVVDACLRAVMNKSGTGGSGIVYAISEGSLTPNTPVGNANFAWNGSGAFTYAGIVVKTNTSGQVYAVSSAASTLLQASTVGYTDYRRS